MAGYGNPYDMNHPTGADNQSPSLYSMLPPGWESGASVEELRRRQDNLVSLGAHLFFVAPLHQTKKKTEHMISTHPPQQFVVQPYCTKAARSYLEVSLRLSLNVYWLWFELLLLETVLCQKKKKKKKPANHPTFLKKTPR